MLDTTIADVLVTARKLVRETTAVKAGEQVLIVGDFKSDAITLNALAAAATEVGAEPTIMVMPPRTFNGDPYTPLVAKAVEGADVIFAAATKDMLHSLVWAPSGGGHVTEDRRRWRVVEMSQASADVMVRPGARADYGEVQRICDKVYEEIKDGQRVRITTDLGTDITGLMSDPSGVTVGINAGSAREVGTWCCFPDGEVWITATGCLGTNPGDAEGVVVFDTAMHMLGLLREPITCDVEAGKVVGIRGGWQAEELKRILDQVPDSNNIIELGSIATNPFSLPHGESMFEDRKTMGTVHVAIGNRYADMHDENGTHRSHFIHLDGVISKPNLWVDDRRIMDEGRLLCL